jgi:DNA-binding transcriptional MerR regulator
MPEMQQVEGAHAGGKLLTLSEVSKRSGISMPTLQRYKKLYQGRIPAVGKGRKQRYPLDALPVFQKIKEENLGRRGRPRKSASGGRPLPAKRRGTATRGRAARAAGRSAGGGLLTLTEVSKRTGVSYPTLVRYVKMHGRQIPHEGRGRRRRYRPEAIEVFERLRAESPRGGRRRGGGRPAGRRAAAPGPVSAVSPVSDKRIERLEKSVGRLEKKLGRMYAKLSKPRRLV